MRIAIFTDTLYPDINGVARTLKRLTEYFDQHSIIFKIFAPSSSASNSKTTMIHRSKSLPFFLYPECRLAFPNIQDVKTELEEFSPDLIHVATPFTMGLCGVYLARKQNVPLVGSYHTNFDDYLQYYHFPFLTKALWKYMLWFHKPCQKLFVPSIDTYQHLKLQGFRNLEIWPRGVDCRLFHPNHDPQTVHNLYCTQEKHLLTFAGRLAPEKDLKTLLAVVKSMPAYLNKKIQWLIVGDGPLRKELEAEAPDNITFTGYLDNQSLAEIYSASTLFIFPSPTETFGNVVLEALASGTPVIGANSGGVKHVIKPGVTGYLCTPGNVEEFTKAIVELLNNAPLRWQMGISGRNFALTQKWDQIFENLIRQYRSVIEERKEQKYA